MATSRGNGGDAGGTKKRITALADHILGYTITGDGGETNHYGPRPHEGLLSIICETFGCTPREAGQQDWLEVQAVIEYRMAHRAAALFNATDDEGAMKELERQPQLMQILAEMRRSQNG